ncbi:hypothetical protein [Kosakonia sp. MUSA4]|uniref:hypothetical protein n=1 Tax=Kosakonia sp. MUSA4 TaxID=2067958 RepID=UPI00159A622C|nr:hypothetical protein [Kosakonia sp. MUSA4]QJT79288.1 hypothetical protein C0557_04030 [Kosakonia sp. MUSA4]
MIYIKAVTNNIIIDPYTGRKYKHDRYFFVGDIGGDLKGDNVDTLCGFKYSCLSPFTAGDKKKYKLSTAIVINGPAIKEKLTRMHLQTSYR